MKIKGFINAGLILVAVLFSYAIANAQNQTPTKKTTTPDKTTTNTTADQPAMPTHKVVVTDNLAKPDASNAQAANQAKTTTKKIGNYSVNVTDNVQGQSMENGKFYTVTTWDGTKWVSKRTWMPNPGTAAAPAKPNP
jgi:hypothetical protein